MPTQECLENPSPKLIENLLKIRVPMRWNTWLQTDVGLNSLRKELWRVITDQEEAYLLEITGERMANVVYSRKGEEPEFFPHQRMEQVIGSIRLEDERKPFRVGESHTSKGTVTRVELLTNK